MPHILPINEINYEDDYLVGEKAASLGFLNSLKIPVPDGFLVSTQAFEYFLEKNNLKTKIEIELNFMDRENLESVKKISQNIQELIKSASITRELADEIFRAYDNLGGNNPLVSIRTSPTEGKYQSGNYPLYLNISGETTVTELVKKVWAAQFKSKFLRTKENLFGNYVSVIVQRMIEAEASGFVHTINRSTGEKSLFEIEAIWGLGELLVQKRVSPDVYLVDKEEKKVLQKIDRNQEIFISIKDEKIVEKKLSKKQLEKEILNDKQIENLITLVKRVDKASYYPQTLEWVLFHDQIYILQTQDLIVDEEEIVKKEDEEEINLDLEILGKGQGAAPGIASGNVQMVTDYFDKKLIDEGEIIVAKEIGPEMFFGLKKASGLVLESNINSFEIALAARENGVPFISGMEKATEILKQEQMITIDGANGFVYGGRLNLKGKDLSNSRDQFILNKEVEEKAFAVSKKIKTATQVFVNLPNGANASIFKNLDVDGVAYVRGENLIAEIGIHPIKLIYEKNEKMIEELIKKRLIKIAREFPKGKIYYRFSDFQNSSFRKLNGGTDWEIEEDNLALGFRGAYRHLVSDKTLMMEIAAIKKASAKCNNLILVLPFIRSLREFELLKQIFFENEIFNEVWLWAISPANLILLPEFIKRGINGVMIDMPYLANLTLGVDNNNIEVLPIYNEMDKSVLWLVEKASLFANTKNVPCVVVSKLVGQYENLVENLINIGIDGFSVPFDLVNSTKMLVKRAEEKKFEAK